jgi:hypothetical protein
MDGSAGREGNGVADKDRCSDRSAGERDRRPLAVSRSPVAAGARRPSSIRCERETQAAVAGATRVPLATDAAIPGSPAKSFDRIQEAFTLK